MTPESEFIQKISAKLAPGVRFDRVENSVLPGQPDITANRNGSVIQVEFKLISGNRISMEPFQVAWFSRSASEGSIAKIVGKKDTQLLMWSCRQFADLLQYGLIAIRGMGRNSPNHGIYSKTTTRDKFVELCCWSADENKANWAEFAEALFS